MVFKQKRHIVEKLKRHLAIHPKHSSVDEDPFACLEGNAQ
jgi:hypothetical protein